LKTTEQDKKKRDTFSNRCLRHTLRIRWSDTISNGELHRRAERTKASEIIIQKDEDG
jgi:hypothetical protein